MYVCPFPFLNQFRHCAASCPLKMSRLSRLDSSSSSDDGDDALEETLTALHQAHTQYHALHAPRWGGSVPRQQYIHRDRESRHWRLYNDYFSKNPTYGPSFFRRRFANSLLIIVYLLYPHSYVYVCLVWICPSGLGCLVHYTFA